MDLIAFSGPGLRTGESCGVTLCRSEGPLALMVEGVEVLRDEMTPRTSSLRLGVGLRNGREIDGVEHLFAALAGLGVQHGIQVAVNGPELPLLDGSARELALALRSLGPRREAPRLVVAQSGEVIAGASRYSFEPKPAIDIAVEIEERPVGRQRAIWDGNPSDFIKHVAGARIYDHAAPEAQTVLRQAKGADPATVLMLRADGSAEPPGAAPNDGELADHRLLDLLADLYFFGGPPLGRVRAWRPNHAATHHAVKQALEFGLLVRR